MHHPTTFNLRKAGLVSDLEQEIPLLDRKIRPLRHRSTILGIYYFSAMEGSGVLTPVMGYLIDHFGFYLSFTMAGAALLAVTLACSIFLWGNRD